MDILYHVNRNEDDINTTKINIDELYENNNMICLHLEVIIKY